MNSPEDRPRWLSGVFAILLFPLACGCASSEAIPLTQVQNGRPMDIHPGQSRVINLDSNPTTGFKWKVAVSEERSDTLRVDAIAPK
jgi:predicted secreted protein